MKRLFALLLIIILIFCACSSKNNIDYNSYEVYEVYSDENQYLGEHLSEFDLKSDLSKELKLIKNKTVSVNGVEYKVTYEDTLTGYWYNGKIDFYEGTTDRGNLISLGINRDTGVIDRYDNYEKVHIDTSLYTEKTEEECLQIAKDYLSTYVDDIDSYRLDKKSSRQANKVPYYSFTFYRYIEEVKTYDLAIIEITYCGDVFSHYFDCLGALKGVNAPDEATLNALNEKVTEKLDEIYSSVKDEYTVEYGDRDVTLIKLSDGKYAMEYYVDINVIKEDDTGFIEASRILICFE